VQVCGDSHLRQGQKSEPCCCSESHRLLLLGLGFLLGPLQQKLPAPLTGMQWKRSGGTRGGFHSSGGTSRWAVPAGW
jgi:hypothetical protein